MQMMEALLVNQNHNLSRLPKTVNNVLLIHNCDVVEIAMNNTLLSRRIR